MHYILFDLEFNSAKNEKTGKFVNEIIEIGAIKLDEDFNEIDSFSQVIKPQLTDHLNRYVKRLTNIRDSDLINAQNFKTVIEDFRAWCIKSGSNAIFLTWSNTDLHVLIDNYTAFLGKSKIDFINHYVDLQKYVSRFIKTENNNQVSLSTASEYFQIDTSEMNLHRGLVDSKICGLLLKATFDARIFSIYTINISKGDFYKRFLFKPYYISDITSNLVDKKELILNCPYCKKKASKTSPYIYKYKSFNANFNCKSCNKNFLLSVKFRKTYESVIVSRTIKSTLKTKHEPTKSKS